MGLAVVIGLVIIGVTYVVSLAILVFVDWASGWSISEAFGRPFPGSDDAH